MSELLISKFSKGGSSKRALHHHFYEKVSQRLASYSLFTPAAWQQPLASKYTYKFYLQIISSKFSKGRFLHATHLLPCPLPW